KCDRRMPGYLRLVKLPHHRRQHMRCLQVKIVIWTVQIRRHQADEVLTELLADGLTGLDTGYLSYRIPLIRGFQWPGEQVFLLERLRCQFGIDARAAEKYKLLDIIFQRSAYQIVLYLHIIHEKLVRILII